MLAELRSDHWVRINLTSVTCHGVEMGSSVQHHLDGLLAGADADEGSVNSIRCGNQAALVRPTTSGTCHEATMLVPPAASPINLHRERVSDESNAPMQGSLGRHTPRLYTGVLHTWLMPTDRRFTQYRPLHCVSTTSATIPTADRTSVGCHAERGRGCSGVSGPGRPDPRARPACGGTRGALDHISCAVRGSRREAAAARWL